MDFFVRDVSYSQLLIYNLFLIAYFIYLLLKYRSNKIGQYIITLFTIGTFLDIGRLADVGNLGAHIYLSTTLIFGIYLLHRLGYKSKSNILFFFSIYIIYFCIVSVAVHSDNLGLVVSQTIRYVIPAITYFIIDSFIKNTNGRGAITVHTVIKEIVTAQIIFCIFKLIVLQAAQEGMVGSLTGENGGGAGTSFPLLCMLWLAHVTKMKFSRKFFLYVAGLLFIGFMTGKRAIWIIFPIEFLVLTLYYRAKNLSQSLVYIAPAFVVMCILLYFGLRLSPTLNPDGEVWGRFDLGYAYEYAIGYSGGVQNASGGQTVKEGDGRLGAALLFWNRFTNLSNYDKEIAFGVGNEKIKYFDSENYNDREANMGVNYRGGVTGIVFMFFISGVVGVILFFLYFLQFFSNRSHHKKLVWIILAVTLFDFIFYNGQIVNNVPMQSMLLILLLTVGIEITPKKIVINEDSRNNTNT